MLNALVKLSLHSGYVTTVAAVSPCHNFATVAAVTTCSSDDMENTIMSPMKLVKATVAAVIGQQASEKCQDKTNWLKNAKDIHAIAGLTIHARTGLRTTRRTVPTTVTAKHKSNKATAKNIERERPRTKLNLLHVAAFEPPQALGA